ncbi:MAG: hypothetical protein ABEJ61_09625 [Haloferacaceae archaeon]
MPTIEEKRVYEEQAARTDAYVASDAGLVRVAVSADRVGRFTLARRGPTRDVAVADGRLVVATDETVVVDGTATDVGPATAVGTDGAGAPLAAADGRLARHDGTEWVSLGAVESVAAIDRGLVVAADGVHRVVEDGLASAGLPTARDVAGGATPLAATDDGLYALGNGWMEVASGAFRAVAAAPGGRAVAVGDEGLVGRADEGSEWVRLPGPPGEGRVVDVGAASAAWYAVTAAGRFLAVHEDEVGAGEAAWRPTELGVRGVARLAVGDAAGRSEDAAAGSA